MKIEKHQRFFVINNESPCLFSNFCILYIIMKSSEIIKRLKNEGWFIHHTRGDHFQFKHPDKSGKVTVPHPKKDLPVGTLRNIFRQANWKWR